MSEQNATFEPIKITLLDGVERTLRYSLRTMKEAREEFGGSIGKIETLMSIDETKLGRLLWYGLRVDDPDLTVEHIEANLELHMLPMIMERYAAALGIRKAQQATE